MKKLIILGGSGIGMIAASIARDLGFYKVLGFLNDIETVGSEIGKFKKFEVLGTTRDLPKFLADRDIYFFIAYVGMQNEKDIYNKVVNMEIPRERYATLIHPSAIIPRGFCEIGYGVMMAPLVQISPDTTISDNCILLPNSFLGHNSFMDRFSHLATNGVVGANVNIGKAVHVGSNATIREKVNIGDYSLVGAGSVVLNDVAENMIVAGNPAKTIRVK